MPESAAVPPEFLRREEIPIPESAGPLHSAGKAADENFPSTPAGSAVLPCGAPKKTWIEIQILDAAGEPVQNRSFKLKLPTGEIRPGTTDSNGLAGFDGIDPGDCELTFDDFKFTE